MFIHPEIAGLCWSALYLLRVGAYKKSALALGDGCGGGRGSFGVRSPVIEREVKREREMERNFFRDSLSCQLERKAPKLDLLPFPLLS